ncbi:MAG: GMP synthase [Cyanobacteria bacterium P01_F01_bin.150]
MRIGILEADQVAQDFIGEFGSYGDMVESWLYQAEKELLFRRYDVVQEIYPQDIAECDAYIITGSKASAYDQTPWVYTLSQFIRNLYTQSTKKIIGICFGHQIIAQTLGGLVSKSSKGWGIGLAENKVYEEETWMLPFAKTFKLLVSHQDQVVNLPENAKLIAGNTFCPYSVLKYGTSVLTFQGHPEHRKAYTQALMLSRKGVIEEETLLIGLRSLEDEDDAQLIARWVINFLRQSDRTEWNRKS